MIPGEEARQWLSFPNPNALPNSKTVRPWINGLDITRRPQDVWIVDFGDDMSEADASLFERPFEHITQSVKHDLLLKQAEWLAKGKNTQHLDKQIQHWWLFWCTRPEMRKALVGQPRYIATARVAKHRLFAWVSDVVIADSQVVVIARADDTNFGIVHSRFHELWALRLGTSLEDRPRYTPTTTFETFPFPAHLTPKDTVEWRGVIPADCPVKSVAEKIAAAAEKLNNLREAWLNPPEWVEWVITPEEEKAGFPKRPVAKPGHEADVKKRTLTNLYNARPAWLDMAHKELDAAVAEAYGWTDYTPEMPDEEILRRLLTLNLERATYA